MKLEIHMNNLWVIVIYIVYELHHTLLPKLLTHVDKIVLINREVYEIMISNSHALHDDFMISVILIIRIKAEISNNCRINVKSINRFQICTAFISLFSNTPERDQLINQTRSCYICNWHWSSTVRPSGLEGGRAAQNWYLRPLDWTPTGFYPVLMNFPSSKTYFLTIRSCLQLQKQKNNW